MLKLMLFEFALSVLNSFRENIKFTYEVENNGKLYFWMFYYRKYEYERIKNSKQLCIGYQHIMIYLHWDSFAPMQSWKRDTLKHYFYEHTQYALMNTF